MLVRIEWVCELCFRTVSASKLPPGWDLVWQSAICPACQKRGAERGDRITQVRGGAYAFGATDPREHIVPEPKAAV